MKNEISVTGISVGVGAVVSVGGTGVFVGGGDVGGAVAVGGLSLERSAHAAGSDVIRIGMVGCGGRCSGAAANAMDADAPTAP